MHSIVSCQKSNVEREGQALSIHPLLPQATNWFLGAPVPALATGNRSAGSVQRLSFLPAGQLDGPLGLQQSSAPPGTDLAGELSSVHAKIFYM